MLTGGCGVFLFFLSLCMFVYCKQANFKKIIMKRKGIARTWKKVRSSLINYFGENANSLYRRISRFQVSFYTPFI